MFWLINSMEPSISKTYMFLSTAKEIWEATKETFGKFSTSLCNFYSDLEYKTRLYECLTIL